jgi:hypothetical protein
MGFTLLGILSSAASGGVLRAGYITGGGVNFIDKFELPSETRTTLAATFPTTLSGSTAFADSGVAGYAIGSGSLNPYKITTPTDSISSLAALSFAVGSGSSVSNSGVAGYSTDQPPSGFVRGQSLYKFSFPSDSRTFISNFFGTSSSDSKGRAATGSNYGTAAYWFGGRTNAGTNTNVIDRINFPADTRTRLAATLFDTRWDTTGSTNQAVASYIAGGRYGGSNFWIGRVEKFSFSTETISSLGDIAPALTGRGGFANSGVAGYFAGGASEFGTVTSSVTKLDFSSDTVSGLPVGLSTARAGLGGFSDEGVF